MVPAAGAPDPDQRPRQRRLARARRADDPQRLPRLQGEGHAAQHRLVPRPGTIRVRLRTSSRAAGRGRAVRGTSGGTLVSSCLQPRPGLPGAGQHRPLADRHLDRLQRAAHQDRPGDHRAGRQLAPQHQPGADARGWPIAGTAGRSWSGPQRPRRCPRQPTPCTCARPRSACQRPKAARVMPSARTSSDSAFRFSAWRSACSPAIDRLVQAGFGACAG